MAEHWNLDFFVNLAVSDFAEEEIGDSNSHLYDVDEPTVGVGFMYTW